VLATASVNDLTSRRKVVGVMAAVCHIYIYIYVCVCVCVHICIYGTLQIDLLLAQLMHNLIYHFLLQVSSEFILQTVENGDHLKVS